MKKNYLLLLVFLAALPATKAQDHYAVPRQDSIRLKPWVLKAQVHGPGQPAESFTGYLNQLGDTAMSLTFSPAPYAAIQAGHNKKTYRYDQVGKLVLQRQGSVGRGLVIGASAGLLAGFITGLIMGDDPRVPPEQDFLGLHNAFRTTAFQKALVGGLVGSLGGAVVGGIIGTVAKKSFTIGGNKKKYEDMREKLLGKLYIKE